MSSSFLNLAPARTSPTKCGALTARQPGLAASIAAESETTVSTGTYLPNQRCRAGLAWNHQTWNHQAVTREGTLSQADPQVSSIAPDENPAITNQQKASDT